MGDLTSSLYHMMRTSSSDTGVWVDNLGDFGTDMSQGRMAVSPLWYKRLLPTFEAAEDDPPGRRKSMFHLFVY